jgi:hypothetical protein
MRSVTICCWFVNLFNYTINSLQRNLNSYFANLFIFRAFLLSLLPSVYSRLVGGVISVLVTGPKGRMFKPDRGYEFLMAIEVPSPPSFGREVKPEARVIFTTCKEPCAAWLTCYVSKIQGRFSPPLYFTARCLWCNQRALMNESGVLELRWERTINQKWLQCLGRFVRHHSLSFWSSLFVYFFLVSFKFWKYFLWISCCITGSQEHQLFHQKQCPASFGSRRISVW